MQIIKWYFIILVFDSAETKMGGSFKHFLLASAVCIFYKLLMVVLVIVVVSVKNSKCSILT